jgi:chemotaxis protein methyltransferase CheR
LETNYLQGVLVTNNFRLQTIADQFSISDDELAEIALILEMKRNFSISAYKDACMKRRVAIRMRSCNCTDPAVYCNLLKQDSTELDRLQKTMTIHVSQFFRNPSVFDKLRTEVLPALYSKSTNIGAPLKILSLGCASGEEAYSLAIIILEYFSESLIQAGTLINAIDIDIETIKAAEKALYNPDRLKELPEALIRKYFKPAGLMMQLSHSVQEMVRFSLGNIMAIDKLQPHDLILCRNTLIYFDRLQQENILSSIADILPKDGILVLGKSETLLGDVRRRFISVCPIERIYKKI